MEAAAKKRTYNLPPGMIEEVRNMASALHVSQDSVVERSIREYARLQRDIAHESAWAVAAADPEFQAEMASLASEFSADDLAAWER